jgi:DNA-binding transcriptional ArsR family regulator
MEKIIETPIHRILDTISSHLGEPLSINQLTEKIKEKYGAAYYSNIYKQIKELENKGLLTTASCGKSKLIKPNFDNELIIELFAQMEIENKINFLQNKNELLVVLSSMTKSLDDICSIKSITSINPEKNSQLNRLELLFLLRKKIDYKDVTFELYMKMRELQDQFNLRIDSLILNEDDFSSLIRSNEINPLRETFAKEITIFCPQAFWSQIKEISEESEIKTLEIETKPNHISEIDLIYNLNRFGYKEFGNRISQANKYCLEYIITSLLLSNDARKLEAIPIILAKNNFRGNLLAFLCQKYRTIGKLLGLLKILQNIKPSDKIRDTINLLEIFKEEQEISADEESIRRNMRLYNVIR